MMKKLFLLSVAVLLVVPTIVLASPNGQKSCQPDTSQTSIEAPNTLQSVAKDLTKSTRVPTMLLRALRTADDPTASNPVDGSNKLPTVAKVRKYLHAKPGDNMEGDSRSTKLDGRAEYLLRKSVMRADPLLSNPVDGSNRLPTVAKVRATKQQDNNAAANEHQRKMAAERIKYQVMHHADDPLSNNPVGDSRAPMVPNFNLNNNSGNQNNESNRYYRAAAAERSTNGMIKNPLNQRGNPTPF
jgi:hypothetical protein